MTDAEWEDTPDFTDVDWENVDPETAQRILDDNPGMEDVLREAGLSTDSKG